MRDHGLGDTRIEGGSKPYPYTVSVYQVKYII